MSGINRRQFLGAAGATALASTFSIGASGESPNEKVGVAVLGCGRGANLARWFSKAKHSQVVAICDPDEGRARGLVGRTAKESGSRPEQIVDFRSVLDRKDVDAIAVATPDH